ncbi:hypothetical protein SARC_11441 [Sphaeroforma arctica JP610]|uniref:Uncharacterized protein n=1 Tax=Sphaeroforma arctica JP610 TaxID=667725 RepID=A0A0L0FH15_9EUKA|nr:hypothetical protein SARC_11441 [Sphaeroforma arctica JP610]KNC76045.1 hypothetical protein SARC_11441 [Sphaeroforma arctica JP610]|eukprot:XP_014149947.1 hypothetical protein SARC_11441 [Sphaeroforma arctica JP610]
MALLSFEKGLTSLGRVFASNKGYRTRTKTINITKRSGSIDDISSQSVSDQESKHAVCTTYICVPIWECVETPEGKSGKGVPANGAIEKNAKKSQKIGRGNSLYTIPLAGDSIDNGVLNRGCVDPIPRSSVTIKTSNTPPHRDPANRASDERRRNSGIALPRSAETLVASETNVNCSGQLYASRPQSRSSSQGRRASIDHTATHVSGSDSLSLTDGFSRYRRSNSVADVRTGVSNDWSAEVIQTNSGLIIESPHPNIHRRASVQKMIERGSSQGGVRVGANKFQFAYPARVCADTKSTTRPDNPQNEASDRICVDPIPCIIDTYGHSEYDRRSRRRPPPTQESQNLIYEELMAYKFSEMPVHEASMHNMNVHLTKSRGRQRMNQLQVLARVGFQTVPSAANVPI